MDPRQRAADRRYLRAMALWLLIGAGFIGVGVALVEDGIDPWYAGWRQLTPADCFVIGGVFLVSGASSLGRRLVRGPDQPGRHARD